MTRFMMLSRVLFSLLMRLYPPEFRGEFGVEMQSVFAARIAEAARSNPLSVVIVWLRELQDLPINLLREHWQAGQGLDERSLQEMFTQSKLSIFIGLVLPCCFVVFLLVVNPNFVAQLFTDVLGWGISVGFLLIVLLNALLLTSSLTRQKNMGNVIAALTLFALFSAFSGPAAIMVFQAEPQGRVVWQALVAVFVVLDACLAAALVVVALKARTLRPQT